MAICISTNLYPGNTEPLSFCKACVSPFLPHQFEELAKQTFGDSSDSGDKNRSKLVVIGQHCVGPLPGTLERWHEVQIVWKEVAQKRRNMVTLRRKKREEKTRTFFFLFLMK